MNRKDRKEFAVRSALENGPAVGYKGVMTASRGHQGELRGGTAAASSELPFIWQLLGRRRAATRTERLLGLAMEPIAQRLLAPETLDGMLIELAALWDDLGIARTYRLTLDALDSAVTVLYGTTKRRSLVGLCVEVPSPEGSMMGLSEPTHFYRGSVAVVSLEATGPKRGRCSPGLFSELNRERAARRSACFVRYTSPEFA